MNNMRTVDDYRQSLLTLLQEHSAYLVADLGILPPKTTEELIIYNQTIFEKCLDDLYKLKKRSALAVLPFQKLKEEFLSKYYTSASKPRFIHAWLKRITSEIVEISKNELKHAISVYRRFEKGKEDSIFKIPYGSKSYRIFEQTALVYDLVKFKFYLYEIENSLPSQGIPITELKFSLTESQLDALFFNLKGRYISSNTAESDFKAVFTLNKVENANRIRWVCTASRNKNQINRSPLFRLIIELNELDSYSNQHLKPEIFAFIANSFADENGNELTKLPEAHRNYKSLEENGALAAMSSLIRKIKER